MAIAKTTINSDLLAIESDGTIAFIGKNLLTEATALTWQRSSSGTLQTYQGVVADQTDPLKPTTRAFDGRMTIPTACQGTSGQVQWVFFAAWATDQVADSMLLRINSIARVTDIFVDLDDDAAFSGADSVTRMWACSVGAGNQDLTGDVRIVYPSNRRWTGIRYLRIAIFTDSTDTPPEISECFLGARRTLPWPPNEPWSPEPYGIDRTQERPRGRDRARLVNAVGWAEFVGEVTLVDAAYTPASINGASEVRALWRECGYGNEPVVFWPDTTEPVKAYLCEFEDTVVDLPIVAFSERPWEFELVELPPFLEGDDRETVILPNGETSTAYTRGY